MEPPNPHPPHRHPPIHVSTDNNRIKNITDLSSSSPHHRAQLAVWKRHRSESRDNVRALVEMAGVCSRGYCCKHTHEKKPGWPRQPRQRAPLPPAGQHCASSQWHRDRGEVNSRCIGSPSPRARPVNASVPPWCVMDQAPLQEVYTFPAWSRGGFFLFVFYPLCSCVSSSSSQNKFSSKIAIKSLWKFISIVAVIWKQKGNKDILLNVSSELISE